MSPFQRICVLIEQSKEMTTESKKQHPITFWASLVAQTVKNLPAMLESWVWSLGWQDPLEEGIATHSSILAWRIPWTEDPGGFQPVVFQRVGHDWATKQTNLTPQGSSPQYFHKNLGLYWVQNFPHFRKVHNEYFVYYLVWWCVSCSVVSNSLWPHRV